MRWKAPDFFKFWASERGQKVAGGFVFTAAVTAGLAHALPNGPLCQKYTDVVRAYHDGFPVPLRPDVEKRAEIIADATAELPRDRKVKFFTACGYDAWTIGTTRTHFGASVGLPHNINYTKTRDVDLADLTIRDKPFPASSDNGRRVLETLLLSPDAQKFLIARELSNARSLYPFWTSGLSAASVFMAYVWSFQFNRKLNLFVRPFKWRLCLYALMGSIAGTFRLMLGDLLCYRRENTADEEAASLGPEFAAGGVEYYSKTLERNVLLRDILGPVDGPKGYTPSGNVEIVFRTRHVPLTARKDAVEKISNDFKNKSSGGGASAVKESVAAPAGEQLPA